MNWDNEPDKPEIIELGTPQIIRQDDNVIVLQLFFRGYDLEWYKLPAARVKKENLKRM